MVCYSSHRCCSLLWESAKATCDCLQGTERARGDSCPGQKDGLDGLKGPLPGTPDSYGRGSTHLGSPQRPKNRAVGHLKGWGFAPGLILPLWDSVCSQTSPNRLWGGRNAVPAGGKAGAAMPSRRGREAGVVLCHPCPSVWGEIFRRCQNAANRSRTLIRPNLLPGIHTRQLLFSGALQRRFLCVSSLI